MTKKQDKLSKSDDEISPEDAEKLGKAFGKMMMAEMSGEEPDFSEFEEPVVTEMDTALQVFLSTNNIDPAKMEDDVVRKLGSAFSSMSNLTPEIEKRNAPYLRMVRSDQYVPFSAYQVFAESRGYKGQIDEAVVEKQARALDVEIRNLDIIARAEVYYHFSNEILSVDSTNNSYPLFNRMNTDNFGEISNPAKLMLQNLIAYYRLLQRRIEISFDGNKNITQLFDKDMLDDLVQVGKEPASSFSSKASLSKESYLNLLGLTKTLFLALPTKFATLVTETSEASIDDFMSNRNNKKIIAHSKHLRDAFIELMQERGSFLSFFKAVYVGNEIMNKEINRKLYCARSIVDVYNALNLDISKVIEASSERILNDTFRQLRS